MSFQLSGLGNRPVRSRGHAPAGALPDGQDGRGGPSGRSTLRPYPSVALLRYLGVLPTKMPEVLKAGGLLAALLLAGCEGRQEVPADVALRIDKDDVHYSAFEAYLRANVDANAVDLSGKTLSSLLDQFLDEQLLQRLAVEGGLLPKGGDGRLAAMLLLEKVDPQLDKAEVEKYYFEHLEEFRRPDRVRLRQILVYDRPTAEKALAQLKKGESFAEVAARFSQDPKAQSGGDQGVLGRDDLPPSFVETIFRLGPGQISAIVEAEYGFQIFKVEEVLPATVLPFESARATIEEQLRRRRVDQELVKLLAEARQKFKVEIFTQNVPFVYQGVYSHAKP